ncbi:hypothetical protein T439DRAFT_110735 [Meredithblackwellia eburnea MCA 4105]
MLEELIKDYNEENLKEAKRAAMRTKRGKTSSHGNQTSKRSRRRSDLVGKARHSTAEEARQVLDTRFSGSDWDNEGEDGSQENDGKGSEEGESGEEQDDEDDDDEARQERLKDAKAAWAIEALDREKFGSPAMKESLFSHLKTYELVPGVPTKWGYTPP